jgi:hypothetical protein
MRSVFVVVSAVVADHLLSLVEGFGVVEQHFLAKGAVHPLVAAVRLGMVGAGAHVRRVGGLHQRDPLAADELAAAVVHDLGFASAASFRRQGVEGGLHGQGDIFGAGGQ